jgi:hypothetical protein
MEDWLPLLGVVIAQVVILAVFWMRQRAEDKRRWHERRLELYSQFAERRLRMAIADSGVPGTGIDTDEEWDAEFNAWWQELVKIELLASHAVYRSADDLVRACIQVFGSRDEFRDLDGEQHQVASGHMDDCATAFLKEVRHELGIERPHRRFAVSADSRTGLLIRAFTVRSETDELAEAALETMQPRSPRR